ncbi:hypothetical protein K443DRAFT_26720, partial [Laccaria amethystina LaAM-08-1]
QIKKIVINCWNASYAPNEDVVPGRTEDRKIWSKWDRSQSSSGTFKYPLDHIQTYLKDDTVSSTTIRKVGGYMKYWFQERNN